MLVIRPVTLRQANEFVTDFHRHHKASRGHKFSIGVAKNDVLVGVAIASRPVARNNDDGFTLEVTRVCTDGTKNACSTLYGAVRRAAKAMGYKRVITYTLPKEGGISLKASGWKLIGRTAGGSWSRTNRQRTDTHPLGEKLIWELRFDG